MAQYLVNFLNTFQGLRKSVVMLALITITSVFRYKGFVGSDNFEGLLKATVVSYFGSNSIEHFSAMVKAHLESKSGVTETVTQIETKTENE